MKKFFRKSIEFATATDVTALRYRSPNITTKQRENEVDLPTNFTYLKGQGTPTFMQLLFRNQFHHLLVHSTFIHIQNIPIRVAAHQFTSNHCFKREF